MASVILCAPLGQAGFEKPEQLTFGRAAETEPHISPDGHWIAFQYFAEMGPRVAKIGILDASKGFASARPLVDQHGYAAEMSWSPDSKWIAFISAEAKPGRNTNQIYKINISTKEIVQLTAFPEGTVLGDSTTWSKAGLIAFERDGQVYCVNDTGGEEVQLLDMRVAFSNRRPSSIRFSPDAKMLIFSVENEQQDQSEIWLADIQSRSFRQLTSLHFDIFPVWIDEAEILFSRETKDGLSEIHALSLRTGHLKRITSGHVDFASSTDSSGHVLYFSRMDRTPEELEHSWFFSGSHIWKVHIGTGGPSSPRVLK
jgi:Tol biopolymer transport system component